MCCWLEQWSVVFSAGKAREPESLYKAVRSSIAVQFMTRSLRDGVALAGMKGMKTRARHRLYSEDSSIPETSPNFKALLRFIVVRFAVPDACMLSGTAACQDFSCYTQMPMTNRRSACIHRIVSQSDTVFFVFVNTPTSDAAQKGLAYLYIYI